MNVEINYLAVLIAGVVSMVLGFLWYSPMVLGKPWPRERGMSTDALKKAQKEMGPLYSISFAVSLVMAYVLARVMAFSGMGGVATAFWIWKLFGIDTGYQLVSLLGMGVVLGLM